MKLCSSTQLFLSENILVTFLFVFFLQCLNIYNYVMPNTKSKKKQRPKTSTYQSLKSNSSLRFVLFFTIIVSSSQVVVGPRGHPGQAKALTTLRGV